MTRKRLQRFYSLLFLAGSLAILLLSISPEQVEAINTSSVTIGNDYSYRTIYPDNGIPDDIMTTILEDIAGRDSRFSHLDRYRHMDYYVIGDKDGGTVADNDFSGYWFIFLENNATTGSTTPIRARLLNHVNYDTYEEFVSDSHASFVPVDRHLSYYFSVDGIEEFHEGVLGYYYNSDGTFSHTIVAAGLLPGENVTVNLFSGSTSSSLYGRLGRLYEIGYDGDPTARKYLLYTNSMDYGTEYNITEIDTDTMPNSGDSGDSDDSGGRWYSWLLDGIINFFGTLLAPIVDFFVNFFEIIWDLIVFIIELIIPLDAETWSDMFDRMDTFLRERFPLLYLVYEYTIGIFLRIMDGMNNPVSLLVIPGNFFGAQVQVDFGAIERNIPEAWPILINLVRALFVISALPSILGFFGRMLFKDGGYAQDDKGGE